MVQKPCNGAFPNPFLNLCKVAVYCPVAWTCAKTETFQSPVAVALCFHGTIKMSKGENQSLNPRNRSCGFSFQPKTVNKALVLYLAITLSVAVVRVCGAIHYQPTINLLRAKTLGNPLNPLLLLHCVMGLLLFNPYLEAAFISFISFCRASIFLFCSIM